MLHASVFTCILIYAAVMSKKCKVVKPDVGSQSSRFEPDNINWKLCCLCQEEKDDHLQCPIIAKGPKCGYEYLDTNLLECQKLNSLPMNVNLDKLDEGSGIAETLQSHSAMYHKSCTSSKVWSYKKGFQ